MITELFGQRVKEVRMSLTFSQEKLAELSGIKRAQLSLIENGNANVTLDTVSKIADALNVDVSELFIDKAVGKSNFIYDYSIDKLGPFVKWAGGKTQLIETIKSFMPASFNTYYEPFVGGGALFFSIAPKRAYINDFNTELMLAYSSIKSAAEYKQLITLLEKHQANHSEEYYYQVREMDKSESYESLSAAEKAARMIYLNKACFNGLYRVNSKGFFNVPSGKKKTVKAFNPETLANMKNYFSANKIEMTNLDFEDAVETATADDFVYFDPPYDTYDNQHNFTAYSKDGFGKDQQHRLYETFKKLASRGVKVMLSNHNTEFIRNLYKDYNIHVVNAKRMINSKADGRGDVEEVIITNY